MFLSEPLCILTAGPTVDGRNVEQKIIDEIAETYSTDTYTARINEDHLSYSFKFGSVHSVEKRDNQLFARIKPNSYLLSMVERGQLLHTSCEFVEDFAGSGKAYLTGLALTDNPASLGTTQIQLSASTEGKMQVIGNPIDPACFSTNKKPDDDMSIIKKFFNLLKGAQAADEQFSRQEEPEEMSKEIEALLKQSIEQNQQLSANLSTVVESLSKRTQPKQSNDDDSIELKVEKLSSKVDELAAQLNGSQEQPETLESTVEKLSGQIAELTTKLSGITDETPRTPAGTDGSDMYL